MRGIFKSQMQTIPYFSRKERTGFISFITNRDNIVPLFIQIFINIFRFMFTYINTHFFHHLNSCRVYPDSWFGSCREDLQSFVERLQKPCAIWLRQLLPVQRISIFIVIVSLCHITFIKVSHIANI